MSEPKTLRGLQLAYCLYTARFSLADLEPARRPATTLSDPDRQPPADPGTQAAPRPSDVEPGSGGYPASRCSTSGPFSPARVVLEKLRTVAARGRVYDVVAHQQAAMPEQLLAFPAAEPGHDDQEPEAGRREAIDLTALFRTSHDQNYSCRG
ncbi:hypothetical protein [Streptomyces sp. NPDC058145]|uniref:hypothetical protein n=1 Tax=Streptomyces sp. NPDC058145 TaxID=3346356 RepID=UPI0036EC5646